MHLFDENLCISKLATVVDADRKTIREDLLHLTRLGLADYTPSSSKNNPGRRGCKPKLTKKGKSVALKAYDFDEEQDETWVTHIDASCDD
jgi:hypothetical protein